MDRTFRLANQPRLYRHASSDAIWSGFTAFVAGTTFSGAFLVTTLAMRLA